MFYLPLVLLVLTWQSHTTWHDMELQCQLQTHLTRWLSPFDFCLLMQNPMQTLEMWGNNIGASENSLTLCVVGYFQSATSIWRMHEFAETLHEAWIIYYEDDFVWENKTCFTTWPQTLNPKWQFEGVPRFPAVVMINAAAMSFINVSAVDWAYGFAVGQENKKINSAPGPGETFLCAAESRAKARASVSLRLRGWHLPPSCDCCFSGLMRLSRPTSLPEGSALNSAKFRPWVPVGPTVFIAVPDIIAQCTIT